MAYFLRLLSCFFPFFFLKINQHKVFNFITLRHRLQHQHRQVIWLDKKMDFFGGYAKAFFTLKKIFLVAWFALKVKCPHFWGMLSTFYLEMSHEWGDGKLRQSSFEMRNYKFYNLEFRIISTTQGIHWKCLQNPKNSGTFSNFWIWKSYHSPLQHPFFSNHPALQHL